MVGLPNGSGILIGCGDGTFALVEDRSSYEDDRKAEVEAIKARKLRSKLPQPPARLDGLVLKVVSTVLYFKVKLIKNITGLFRAVGCD